MLFVSLIRGMALGVEDLNVNIFFDLSMSTYILEIIFFDLIKFDVFLQKVPDC